MNTYPVDYLAWCFSEGTISEYTKNKQIELMYDAQQLELDKQASYDNVATQPTYEWCDREPTPTHQLMTDRITNLLTRKATYLNEDS